MPNLNLWEKSGEVTTAAETALPAERVVCVVTEEGWYTNQEVILDGQNCDDELVGPDSLDYDPDMFIDDKGRLVTHYPDYYGDNEHATTFDGHVVGFDVDQQGLAVNGIFYYPRGMS